jgi:hypothetical protein
MLAELGDQLPLVLEMGVSRLAPISTKAYSEAFDLLTQEPTPEKIASFRFSADIEERIGDLLARVKAGGLSLAEEIELDRFSRLDERLQLLKVRSIADINARK